jgi:hypothetical protein
MQVAHEDGKNCIVGKAFEDLADVGDPEGAFETGSDLLQASGEGQWLLLMNLCGAGALARLAGCNSNGGTG